MEDDKFRERFEDSDMTLQRYFNEQDAILAYQVAMFIFIILASISSIVISSMIFWLFF